MSTMLKVAGLLNVFTVALLPVSLSGPIQSPTTPFVPGPTDGTKIIASSDTVDSNGCALEPPVSGYAHWYDARDIDGDGVLDEESDTDPVATWVDKGSAGKDLSQSTSGYRPVVETDCRGVTGSRCVLFQDVDDTLAASTASDWDFLSDDSTDYNVLVAAYTNTSVASDGQVLFGTIYNTVTPSGNGAMFGGMHNVYTSVGMTGYRKGTGYTDYRVKYGVQSGTSFILNPEYTTSDDGINLYINGHGLPASTHSTHNAADCPLYLARASSSPNCTTDVSPSWYGGIHQILIYKTTLSDSDRESINDWMRCLQGAEPLPTTDSQGCDMEPPVSGYTVWFDGRDVDGNGLEDSTDATSISAWTPKGTLTAGYRAETVAQATSSAKPTVDDDCISTNGPWCVYFDGGDFLAGNTASSWDFWNGTSDITFVGLVAASSSGANGTWAGAGVDPSGADKGITLSHRSTGPTLGLYGSTASSNGYVQLNGYASPSTITDMLSVMYIFDRTGASEAYKYIDNTLQATDSTIIDGDGVAGALEIGRQYSSGIATFTGNLMQLLVYEHDFTSDDRSAMQTWLGCLRGD